MDDETKLYINDLKVSIHVERSRRDTYRNAIAEIGRLNYAAAAEILATLVEQDDVCELHRKQAHDVLVKITPHKADIQTAWKLLHGLRNLAHKTYRSYEARLTEAEAPAVQKRFSTCAVFGTVIGRAMRLGDNRDIDAVIDFFFPNRKTTDPHTLFRETIAREILRQLPPVQEFLEKHPAPGLHGFPDWTQKVEVHFTLGFMLYHVELKPEN